MASTEMQWKTLSTPEPDVSETKIVFDTIGDEFVGTYLGMREIDGNDGRYKQARFSVDGLIYFVNANHSLKAGLSKARTGILTRIAFTDEMDTGQASPMRVFEVQQATGSKPTKVTANT